LDLQDDLIAAREELRLRATYDLLTGIPNRATVMDALRNELSRQVREHRAFGVILADIDHFKNVNDTYGHLCGDEVLQTVARRMKECMRPYDSVGRYGGEEFLIIASNADAAGTLALAERIRGVIQAKPVATQAGEVRITVSLGAVVCTSAQKADPETLLRLADEALYRAKELGRNRSELAGSPVETRSGPATAEYIPLKSGRR
jgi:two-component system, cell cycle response regulator